MTITPHMIKELREKTGVGIGKCKEALEEAKAARPELSGQSLIDEAVAILRKAGIASAVKKEGRAANEGMIAHAESNGVIGIVEVNAETDFVVKNDRFQSFLQDVAEQVAATKPASLEDLMAQRYSKDPSLTLEEYRASVVQAIGENIQVRRLKVYEKGGNNSVGVYSHLGGKIMTAVEIEGSNGLEGLAKDIAMHIAAASPDYINPQDVPASLIEHEKEIARSQVQGRPADVVEKILEGKISKFFDEVCLNRQPYIKNDKITVGELVNQQGKDLKIKSFLRWSVGQN